MLGVEGSWRQTFGEQEVAATAAIFDMNDTSREMGGALGRKQPQWTGGIPILTAAVNIPDSDPLKGLF